MSVGSVAACIADSRSFALIDINALELLEVYLAWTFVNENKMLVVETIFLLCVKTRLHILLMMGQPLSL